MTITMDAAPFNALISVVKDAIHTLEKVAASTHGWDRQSVVLQLDGLKATLQEALLSASAPLPSLRTPNTSQPVRGIIGHVHCIDVAPHFPPQLRYYGAAGRESGKGPTGQAHLNFEQAEADVKAWYLGAEVNYEKQAVCPLVPRGMSWEMAARELQGKGIARLAPAAAAGVHAPPPHLVAELAKKRGRTEAQIAIALGDEAAAPAVKQES